MRQEVQSWPIIWGVCSSPGPLQHPWAFPRLCLPEVLELFIFSPGPPSLYLLLLVTSSRHWVGKLRSLPSVAHLRPRLFKVIILITIKMTSILAIRSRGIRGLRHPSPTPAGKAFSVWIIKSVSFMSTMKRPGGVQTAALLHVNAFIMINKPFPWVFSGLGFVWLTADTHVQRTHTQECAQRCAQMENDDYLRVTILRVSKHHLWNQTGLGMYGPTHPKSCVIITLSCQAFLT